MLSRRKAMLSGAALLAAGRAIFDILISGTFGAAATRSGATQPADATASYVPVVTPNGSTLTWTMEDAFKPFPLTAEPVKREFAPGMVVNCWGYNGQTPGPTIEAVEGDRVRIYVHNKLPEATTI